MSKPDIVCSVHHVIICAQVVKRPPSISPNQWLRFWERVISSELLKELDK